METVRALPRRGARAALIAAAAAALALAPIAAAAPASAHDQLVASDPAVDAAVDVLPDELTLVFSGELIDAGDGTAVEVISPSGEDVVAGEPELDGTDVTVPLAGGDAGAYEVTWRVVSSDGHPTDGAFSFTTETASPTEDAVAGADEEEGNAADAAEDPSDATDSAANDLPAGSDEAADATSGTPADADSFARNLPWIIGGLLIAAGGGAVIAMAVKRSRQGFPAAGDAGDDDASGGDADSER